MGQSENVPVGAILKAFSIIRRLSEGTASLAELSHTLGIPKGSLHRILATLHELEIVEKAESNDYSLTSKLFEYGAKPLGSADIVTKAAPVMRRVRDLSGETVHLAIRRDSRVIYLHKFDSNHSINMISRIGYHAPLFCTALGKSLLAWMEKDEAEKLIKSLVFQKIMPNTIANAKNLVQHLELVRSQKFSCDDEENEDGVICFGTPVFDYSKQIIAAISVSMPKFRYNSEKKSELIQIIQEAARDISKRQGCQIWPPDEINKN